MKHILKADLIKAAILRGASRDEIAAILGVKPSAVGAQLTRMRKQLGESRIPRGKKRPNSARIDRAGTSAVMARKHVEAWFGGAKEAEREAACACYYRGTYGEFMEYLRIRWRVESDRAEEIGRKFPKSYSYLFQVLKNAYPMLPWCRIGGEKPAAWDSFAAMAGRVIVAPDMPVFGRDFGAYFNQ